MRQHCRLSPGVFFALAAALLCVSLSPLAADEPGSKEAAHGSIAPGQRVPLELLDKPPSLTPDQLRAREESLNEVDLPAPPLRVEPGSVVAPPNVRATSPGSRIAVFGTARPLTGPVQAHDAPPGAASTFTLYRTTAQGPYATSTSTIAETHGANAGSVAFMSGNWFASYSSNNGASFSFVNPYTQFPSVDGGFCCDQSVIYDRGHGQMIWQLQYLYSGSTQKGSYRTAFAPAASVASAGWCYYTWSPSDFALGSGLWLDYPHVALSNNYVWYTANVYNASNQWQRTVIWRIPLAAASTCSQVTFDYYVSSDHFNFTPTQGATTTMYWASHNSTSSIRIYRWDEGAGSLFWDDVTISTWPRTLPYSCPGGDSLNWCGRSPNDGRVQTGWVAGGVIGFMWNASQGGAFPLPHVRVARFNASTRALIDEPTLWHSSFTWQYPAIGVNDRGHIAGSVYYGTSTGYPAMAALIADDYSAPTPPWENYTIVTSDKGASSWGDWYSTRPHGTAGNTWTTTGQARLANGDVQAWYVWFGRERDAPVPTVSSPSSGSIAATTATLGGNVTSDGGTTILERGVVYAPTATNSDPIIGGPGVIKATTGGTTGLFGVGVSALTASTNYSFKAFATNTSGTGYTSPASTFTTSVLAGPAALTATATATTQVNLVWTSVAGAAFYEVARNSGGGYVTVGTPGVAAFTDNGVSAGNAYVYRVRAFDGGGNPSSYSPIDLATTIFFTNDPANPGSTLVRGLHITELRNAVNAVRATAGLSAASFTDSIFAGVTLVRALHVNELRTALNQARTALGLSTLSYTDSLVSGATAVKAIHIQELRDGVR